MSNPYMQYCLAQQQKGRYRSLLPLSTTKVPHSQLQRLDFSSNDYLALAHHPNLCQAAFKAAQQYGVGSTGSRLLSGNFALLNELESCIAKDSGTESALILPSGFQANSNILASLLNPAVLKAQPRVFFDRFNHASLYQAVFLSKAELIRYRHNDMQHLQDLLNRYQNCTRPKFIVAETLFGMDGDLLPLSDIALLCQKYRAFLYLDEAHAIGVVGSHGYGLVSTTQLHDIEYVIMGTFSKALGGFGAYIACTESIRNYMINACPGFIYTTSPSPLVIGAALAAWKMLPSLTTQREQLQLYATFLRGKLHDTGFKIGTSSTHIIPLILGEEEVVIKARNQLLEIGFILSAIRPPTVPAHTARLRIAINSLHTLADIEYLAAELKKLL